MRSGHGAAQPWELPCAISAGRAGISLSSVEGTAQKAHLGSFPSRQNAVLWFVPWLSSGTRHVLCDDGLHGGCWQAGGEFAVSPKASPPARWAPCPARCRMAMYCSVSLHPGTASLSEPSGNRNVRGKSKKLCAC